MVLLMFLAGVLLPPARPVSAAAAAETPHILLLFDSLAQPQTEREMWRSCSGCWPLTVCRLQ